MADKKFNEACLKTHNELRKNHGVSSLKLNKDMSSIAQKWADHLAKTNSFSHSKDREYKGQRMGENIAMKYTSSGDDYTGQQATDQWYSEITKYNFQSGSGAGTGHFTQVVWKDSKELGVGKAKTSDGKWLVVANYLPAGNFVGRYKENVFPPKDGKIAVPQRDAKGSSGGAVGGGFVSSPSPSAAQVTHTREQVRPQVFSTDTSSSSTRSVTREVREGSGPSGAYTKTVVTETIVGPDGRKKTVTRETVTSDGDSSGVADSSARFRSMGFNDRDFTTSSQPYTSGAVAKDVSKEKEKKPQKMKDFVDDVVKSHNKYRKQHNKVGDLKHNKELSVLAQRWADHLAATKVLKHSNDTYKGSPVGENVASKWSSAGADYTGQEVVEQWYDEVKKFDFRRNDFTSGTGHFTQVVWKGSKEVGVGKTLTSDGRVFVVCNYFPAGNVVGQFGDNVYPSK